MKYLIGAGGHASVICDIAKKQSIKIDGVFVDNGAKNITNLPIVDEIANVSNYRNDEFLIAFGNVPARMKLEKHLSDKVAFFTLIDQSAIICENVKIGTGTVIMPGVIINSGAIIGNHAIINSGSIVEHGCIVANHVHMSPKSVLCGNTIVGEGTWIGTGTTVIDDITIGRNCTIGAGSLVIRNIPDNSLSYGVPSKIIKRYSNK